MSVARWLQTCLLQGTGIWPRVAASAIPAICFLQLRPERLWDRSWESHRTGSRLPIIDGCGQEVSVYSGFHIIVDICNSNVEYVIERPNHAHNASDIYNNVICQCITIVFAVVGNSPYQWI